MKKEPSETKKKVNGRRKGSSFERTVAKQLSAWSGLDLRRTPMSGGFSHKGQFAGDINCVDPAQALNFNFTIECKAQESWSFKELLGNKGKLISFWEQCLREVERNKWPLLIFTKNLYPVYVATDDATITSWEKYIDFSILEEVIIVKKKSYFLYIFLLNEFLEKIKFSDFKIK